MRGRVRLERVTCDPAGVGVGHRTPAAQPPRPPRRRPGRPAAAGDGVTGFHWGARAEAGIP